MTPADLQSFLDLVILGGIGGLWFRLGAVLQGQQDNRRRMGDIEARLSKVENRLVHMEK